MKPEGDASSFVDCEAQQRKRSHTTRQEKTSRFQNPWSSLIGYIDYLGIFRCDVDPEGKNGYIKEEIEPDGHLLPIIFSRDEISEWRKDLSIAWEILKRIYQGLKRYKESEEVVSFSYFMRIGQSEISVEDGQISSRESIESHPDVDSSFT